MGGKERKMERKWLGGQRKGGGGGENKTVDEEGRALKDGEQGPGWEDER